jgi:hypothetical protein
MAWIHELKFQPSGTIEEITSHKGYSYVLPDGRRAAMKQQYVWCFGCNGLSWAEDLPTLEEAEEIVRNWEGPTSQSPGQHPEAVKSPDEVRWIVDGRVVSADTWLDLLRVRTEPCHCTKCGCTEFAIIPHGKEFALPDGSGTVTMKCTGHASMRIMPKYFTPNGHRMPIEDVPPAPPEKSFSVPRGGWKDYRFPIVAVLTSPLWVPLALLALIIFGIGILCGKLYQKWTERATGNQ